MTGTTVAIVGGGLSGTLVAMRLLELVRPPQIMRILVIEPRPTLGPGLAYSTCNRSGIARAGTCALPGFPLHFRRRNVSG
jgi:uncharacterized NAD(P)/FAD-binding protein YdhS